MRTVCGILAASVLLLSPMQLIAARTDQGFTMDEKQVFHDYLDQVAAKLVKNAVKKDEGSLGSTSRRMTSRKSRSIFTAATPGPATSS
jgi:hypothetical protein